MTGTRKTGTPGGSAVAPVGAPVPSAVAAEEQLLDQGLLPGIDYCRHAVELSTRGRVPDAGHLLGCPVCLRRWRLTEAGIRSWRPMDHDEAVDALPRMGERFASPERDDSYRAFYAHIATCARCEKRLADLTFDATLLASPQELK